MTITAYGSAARATARATQHFASLKSDLGTLQTQLASGRTAPSYAGLGTDAPKSLAIASSLARLGAYSSNATDATTRVNLMSTGLTQIDTLVRKLSASTVVSPALASSQADSVTTARSNLAATLDVLNMEAGGRYLFAGRSTDATPVADVGLILDGDATHAGLKTLVAQRQAADLGTAGTGRLAVASSGSAATVTGQSPTTPFGFTIAGAASSTAAITTSQAAGPPAVASYAVTAQPAAGDTVTLTLGLPDGSSQTLTLTAAATAGATGTFAIGATNAATAANLSAAIASAVSGAATTTLASASAVKAATDFFASSASNPPQRVAGPPYDSATALTAGSAADTVIWYTGDDAAGSARQTAAVQLGDNESAAIGARANEPAFQKVLAGFAALAVSSFPESDATASGRYAALTSRLSSLLAPDAGSADTIRSVSSDLAIAKAGITSAKTSLSARSAQLQDAADGIENADPTEVATKLMATQTRLSASYQVTATVARLTLADYI